MWKSPGRGSWSPTETFDIKNILFAWLARLFDRLEMGDVAREKKFGRVPPTSWLTTVPLYVSRRAYNRRGNKHGIILVPSFNLLIYVDWSTCWVGTVVTDGNNFYIRL